MAVSEGPGWLRRRATFIACAILGSSALAPHCGSPPGVRVGGYELVDTLRESRTVYHLVYRATLDNGGASPLRAQAVLSTTSPHLTVVESHLSFALAQPGEGVTSLDTFTLRHDRAGSWSETDLHWAVSDAPAPGILLDGDPGGLALEATQNFAIDELPDASEISEDPDRGELVRTELEIAFELDASSAEINALLESIDGRIASMLADRAFAVIRIPDPGDLAGYDALLAQLAADARVRFVNRALVPEALLLPDPLLLGTANLDRVAPQLAIGLHAAWNAQAALPVVSPTVIVSDKFGFSAGIGFDNAFDIALPLGILPTGGTPNRHGFAVTSVIAARHASLPVLLSPDRDHPAGVYPGTVQLIPLQLGGTHDAQNRILAQVASTSGPVVVNTSWGACPRNFLRFAFACTQGFADQETRTWIEKVRGSVVGTSLESRFLHVTAAGNASQTIALGDPTGYGDATRMPPFARAALAPPAGLAPLSNLLVVENRQWAVPAGPGTPGGYEPACLDRTSFANGTLSGIGEKVWLLTSGTGVAIPGAGSAAEELGGTSFSSPQVAGVAALVWALQPGLSPQALRDLLLQTARAAPPPAGTGCRFDTVGAPVVEAYPALLATDSSTFAPVFAPARVALLDVADATGAAGQDGIFDERDLALFVTALDAGPTLDYSRFDLNGDGTTGGPGVARLDLDVNQPPAWGLAEVAVGAEQVRYAETGVTDGEVLCYYAYSPLYTGDASARDGLLGPLRCCANVRYELLDLGVAPGDQQASAYGINAHGDVVGETFRSGSAASGLTRNRGFMWRSSTGLRPLPAIGDPERGSGSAINDSRLAVGNSGAGLNCCGAVSWSDGGAPALLGLAFPSVAYDVNSAGDSVGTEGGAGFVRYADGTIDRVAESRLFAISESGASFGGCSFFQPPFGAPICQPAIWQNGPLAAPTILASNLGEVVDVHDAGYRVGWETLGTRMPSSFGGPPLPVLNSNFRGGEARAVNSHGDIVGHSFFTPSFEGTRGVLWRNGTVTDLNTLIPPGSGFVINFARDINDAGQIVGDIIRPASGSSRSRAALLSPVCESDVE